MREISDDIWIFDGDTVPFFSLPFSTRMTVVRLADNQLWIHSPINLTPELQQTIDNLGLVAYLIAPNHLHHLYIKSWQEAYPSAKTYGTAEVIQKCDGLAFDGTLSGDEGYPWQETIHQRLFTGSPLMQECVFFHRPSRTLIVTDLIENFSLAAFSGLSGYKRALANIAGVMAPNGKTPLDWRLSFMFHRGEAREHMHHIIDWAPTRIILAHGELIECDAVDFLRRSFAWLKLS